MSQLCMIGNVKIPEPEAAKCYAEDAYIVTHGDVYQIAFSAGSRCYYGMPLRALHGHGLVGRGEHKRMTAHEINAGIGMNVLRERF